MSKSDRTSLLSACWLFLGFALLATTGSATGFAQTIAVAAKSERIVGLGGDVTGVHYALGLQGKIVAIDTTSLVPPHALKEKQNVGYMRAPSAEGVLPIGATAIFADA